MFENVLKKTLLGDLPGKFLKGKGILKADLQGRGIPCIRYADIYTRYGDSVATLETHVSEDTAAKSQELHYGDIVFAASGETAEDIGKALAYVGAGRAVVGGDTIILRGHDQHPEFLAHLLNGYVARKQKAAFGHGHSVVHIHAPSLAKVEVALPPLPEQRKIAAILRTWDEAIEKLEQAIALKETHWQAMVSRLLAASSNDKQHLRDHIAHVSTRNKSNEEQRVLSVTNSAGFVLAEQQFAHRVASADLSNYKIVKKGHYAYNPSRINVGSLARLDDWDSGALSPMYVVFRPKKTLDTDFLLHWFSSYEARQRIRLAAQGSVRETVSFGDLGAIMIPVPDLARQKQIARVLNTGRAEIVLLQTQKDSLAAQKRGLMQKLLTGEWPVTPDPEHLQTETTKEVSHA